MILMYSFHFIRIINLCFKKRIINSNYLLEIYINLYCVRHLHPQSLIKSRGINFTSIYSMIVSPLHTMNLYSNIKMKDKNKHVLNVICLVHQEFMTNY